MPRKPTVTRIVVMTNVRASIANKNSEEVESRYFDFPGKLSVKIVSGRIRRMLPETEVLISASCTYSKIKYVAYLSDFMKIAKPVVETEREEENV